MWGCLLSVGLAESFLSEIQPSSLNITTSGLLCDRILLLRRRLCLSRKIKEKKKCLTCLFHHILEVKICWFLLRDYIAMYHNLFI